MKIIYKCCIFKPNGRHCEKCEENVQYLTNLNLTFNTLKEASEFFKLDTRTIKQWNDKIFVILAPYCKLKYSSCFICEKTFIKSRNENKLCNTCSKSKEYLKVLLPEKYKGKNNPNYLHGESRSTEYSKKEWRNLRKNLKIDKCELCLIKDSKDIHHIIPRIFCKFIKNKDMIYDENNLISLCTSCHIGVHHLKLDIELLPILYSQYILDAQVLKTKFLHQPLVQSVLKLDEKVYQELDLFQASRYLGNKKLLPVFQKAVLLVQDLKV